MPTNRLRSNRVIVHLTDEELLRLNLKTEKSGLNREAFLRKVITRSKIKVVDILPLLELNRQVKSLGNNLNQLTRYFNSGYFTDQDYQTLMGVAKEVRELWPLLKRFLQEVQREEP